MKHKDPLLWLDKSCLPHWLERGLEPRLGGFMENLSLTGEPLPGPRRSMVQARQIFSMRVAIRMGLVNEATALPALESGIRVLTSRFSLPSGAFRNKISENGSPLDDTPDLYGQAFALFALAQGFAVLREAALKARALDLIAYLRRERRAPGGGFTELENGAAVYRSNPHMHLFEAALAWLEVDGDPAWRTLSDELLELCLSRFLDPVSGSLAEYFKEGWAPERDAGGRFVWEPGHHCEWSWLLGRYQELTGRDLLQVRLKLFELAESHGKDATRANALIDQLWSDNSPKLRSARFWPQCERVKAAVGLGRAAAAREAMTALLHYFDFPVPGLWFDTWDENGTFREQPIKASSLYHIIGAIEEYTKIS